MRFVFSNMAQPSARKLTLSVIRKALSNLKDLKPVLLWSLLCIRMIYNILMHNNDHKRNGFRSFKLERALRITDSVSFLAEGCAIFEKTNLITRRRLIECSVNNSSFDTRCNELPRHQQHESGYENHGEDRKSTRLNSSHQIIS